MGITSDRGTLSVYVDCLTLDAVVHSVRFRRLATQSIQCWNVIARNDTIRTPFAELQGLSHGCRQPDIVHCIYRRSNPTRIRYGRPFSPSISVDILRTAFTLRQPLSMRIADNMQRRIVFEPRTYTPRDSVRWPDEQALAVLVMRY